MVDVVSLDAILCKVFAILASAVEYVVSVEVAVDASELTMDCSCDNVAESKDVVVDVDVPVPEEVVVPDVVPVDVVDPVVAEEPVDVVLLVEVVVPVCDEADAVFDCELDDCELDEVEFVDDVDDAVVVPFDAEPDENKSPHKLIFISLQAKQGS